jgi:hypothetical protein
VSSPAVVAGPSVDLYTTLSKMTLILDDLFGSELCRQIGVDVDGRLDENFGILKYRRCPFVAVLVVG